ncbi:MAG: hypothetical protein JSV89_03495 [Spirochaetaceae bacterium]|nr:MAG: hypothetical protein JSV89_03495 [Spirochaetaceae bacterium]
MDVTGRVIKLFDELVAEGEAIKQKCKKLYFSGQKKDISPELFSEWKIKCLSLLKSTFGSSSPQFDSFANAKFFDYYNATQVFLGILKAASLDVKKGYFFHKDLMLSVNIYDSLLGRARRYIANQRLRKAEAILEAVLREVLSKICLNKKIPFEQDDGIAALAETLLKAEIIPETVKNELLALQERFLQSNASAGELTAANDWILNFLNDYLGGQILILN